MSDGYRGMDWADHRINQLIAECNRLRVELKQERKMTDAYIRHLHEMQSQRDRLRELLREIYDWTAYKTTAWAKKVAEELQEDRDEG